MKLIDISNWPSGNQRYVPIGKRIKKVVLHPENYGMYYFKEPKEKYPWEFWNEVIAYNIGKELGFDILEYCPAILDGIGGCLSQSMTSEYTQELVHGQQLLIRIFPEFETKKGTDHSFQLVEQFFKSDEIYIPLMNDFIKMLVFDTIIGNRDRHQQNWALIHEIYFSKNNSRYQIFKKKDRNMVINVRIKFSPLFDNGNCLAYNIIEEKIDNYLNDERLLNKYLFGEKAVSHLKWNGVAISHIKLLKNIFEQYPEPINSSINELKEKYNKKIIEDIINEVDNGIIFANERNQLSLKRKQLIIKLLLIRTEKLLEEFS